MSAVNERRLVDSVRPILSGEIEQGPKGFGPAESWIGSPLNEKRQVGSITGRARDQRDNTVQTAHRSANAKSRQNGTISLRSTTKSLRDKHEEGSDEQTRFHQSEHSGTCSRHDSCRQQRDGSG